MDLSVIIVTFNSSPFIAQCISSISEELRGMAHELIIVDNRSTDQTRAIIENQFPQAILVANSRNAGFAGGNNLALRRAKGEVALLINPDTVWRRGKLSDAIHFLEQHPDVGALGCRLILGDGSWQKSHGHRPGLVRELKEALYLPRLFPRSRWMRGVFSYVDCAGPKAVDWISGAFFLSPRRLLEEVGFFDERYFMYYEDVDLSTRIQNTGKKIYYYPDVEIIHLQRWPSLIDFGESPYIYFGKFFGRKSARILRYILLVKTIIRVSIFLPLSILTGESTFRDKLRSNYRSLKFHLFEAPGIIRDFNSLQGGGRTSSPREGGK